MLRTFPSSLNILKSQVFLFVYFLGVYLLFLCWCIATFDTTLPPPTVKLCNSIAGHTPMPPYGTIKMGPTSEYVAP